MNLTGYDLAVSATAAYSNKDEKFDKHFLQSWSIQFWVRAGYTFATSCPQS